MSPSIYLCCLLPLLILLMQQQRRRRVTARRIVQKHKGETAAMLHPEAYIGKICTIVTMNDSNVKGRIIECGDGWLSVDNGKVKNTMNLDYIVRIACAEKDNRKE